LDVTRQAKQGAEDDLDLSVEDIRAMLADFDSPAVAVEQEVTQS